MLQRLGGELLVVLEQLGGGPRADPAHAVPRFLVPAACWLVLARVAGQQWHRDRARRDGVVAVAALIGAARELGQLLAEYGSHRGLFPFERVVRFYPPLEHVVDLCALVLVASAFLAYRLGEPPWLGRARRAALAAVAALTLAALPSWWRFAEAVALPGGPRIELAQHWAEVPFRLLGVAVAGFAALGARAAGGGRGGRRLLVTAFGLIGLDHALMLVSVATGLAHQAALAPVRHVLHLLAVPCFLAVYWVEQRDALRSREGALRTAAEHLRQVFESVPEPLLVVDASGLVRELNGAAYRLLGPVRPSLRGAELAACLAEPGRCREALAAARAGGPVADVPLTLLPPGVAPRQLLLGAVPTERELLVVALRDVTEARQAEAARRGLERAVAEAQRLESLGGLAAGVAHDFNNLLAVVLGNAEAAMADLAPGSRAREAVEATAVAARRAGELARQLMACAGGAPSLPARVELGGLAREMVGLLQTTVGAHHRLAVAVAGDGPALQADATQLRQVLTNLVVNAGEALGGRPGRIEVRVRRAAFDAATLAEGAIPDGGPGEYAVLEVEDDGPGMAPEVVARIFEPFFSTKFTGRGLGLASVMGIVRAHQGGIQVDSTPGRGTTFRILLPLPAGAEAACAVPVAPAAPPPEARPARVLVVDDDAMVRTTASRILRTAGHQVLLAAGGGEALDLAGPDGGAVDLVLLDLTMPDQDGAEVLAALRARRPGLPVVITSAWAAAEVRERLGGQEVSGLALKPWTPAELRGAVARALAAPRDGA